MLAFGAVRAPKGDVLRPFAVMCLLWPASQIFIAFAMLIDLFGWTVDLVESDRVFGFRKPGNPEVWGFAVALFGQELRVFKARKG